MNIRDSYIHGADGKGVVKFLYFATGVESVLKADGSANYNTAAAKDIILLLADAAGTKVGLPIPTLNQNTSGYAALILTEKKSTNASYYLTFVDSNNNSATAESVYTNVGLYFNPTTGPTGHVGTLYVNNISGDNIGITIGNTFVALGGTYTPATSITSSSDNNSVPGCKAVWDAILAGMKANDAMRFMGFLTGGVDAAHTAYTPTAERGDTYKVQTAGYINGNYYQVNDTFICTTDSTAQATSSNVSTIKTNWGVVEGNGDYLSYNGGTMYGTLSWDGTTALPTVTTASNILVVDSNTTKQISLANLKTALGVANTWRNIYTGGTSRVGTGIDTKAMNFASSNLNITYLAAGTSTGQSGNANYFTINFEAKNWTGATSSAAGTTGYMPGAASADRLKYLRGDGSWVALAPSISTGTTNTNKVKITVGGENSSEYLIPYASNTDKVDGYHANKIGTTDISARHIYNDTGDNFIYYKIGTLPTTADTHTGHSSVVFSLYNANDYGSNNPSKWTVTASSRNNYNITAVKHIGVTHINVGYVIADNKMEIWVEATSKFLEGAIVEIHASRNFTEVFTSTTTKPSNWVNGTIKEVSYNGHTHTYTWDGITSKPAAIGDSTTPIYWDGSTFILADSYPTKNSWNYDDRYVTQVGAGTGDNAKKLYYTLSGQNIYFNVPYSLDSDKLDGLDSTSFVRKYDFMLHDNNIKLGTFNSQLSGHFLTLKIYTGSGYNAIGNGFGVYTIYIRASNGQPTNGRYFEAYAERHYSKALSFYIKEIDKNNCEIWIKSYSYSGSSYYEVSSHNGISWTHTATVETLPTGNIFLIPDIRLLDTNNSSVSGGGSTAGSSISVKINDVTKTLTIPTMSSQAEEIYNNTTTLTVDNWSSVKDISSYTAGTYAISINASDLYASGIFSMCEGTDVMIDEIVLHVSNKTNGATWRPYARISGKNLQLSCNEATGTARTYIVKILKLI